ncbi:hypothetical protein F5887DRAFT_917062 [Amanita rubescens]|nr:hypothetical protein F5887DRAFT_1260633 [Amanita rubescens]KAF8345673.1 hypothetical protein F5887DRAFT_917062 [Amanita rubescens]
MRLHPSTFALLLACPLFASALYIKPDSSSQSRRTQSAPPTYEYTMPPYDSPVLPLHHPRPHRPIQLMHDALRSWEQAGGTPSASPVASTEHTSMGYTPEATTKDTSISAASASTSFTETTVDSVRKTIKSRNRVGAIAFEELPIEFEIQFGGDISVTSLGMVILTACLLRVVVTGCVEGDGSELTPVDTSPLMGMKMIGFWHDDG